MRATSIPIILLATVAMFVGAWHVAYGQAGGAAASKTAVLTGEADSQPFEQDDAPPLDDLANCQQYCRSVFGVDPYSMGGGGGGGDARGVGYAVCIQRCNIDFWKARDKEIEKLEKDLK